jgi:hypothetical protein
LNMVRQLLDYSWIFKNCESAVSDYSKRKSLE